MNRYCVGCHNEKLKTGGLVLATVDVDSVSADNAEVLEKVVRKLQARAMPPRGLPRPDEAAYAEFVSHLETSLDRLAAANPNPGRPDTFRRLNRTEYQNAIRDLLDLEVDVAAHSAERRLEPRLRQHQRRRAVADAAGALPGGLAEDQPPGRRHAGPCPGRRDGGPAADLTQEDYFDGQPFGTRAGAIVRYVFPADGEYGFELRLTRDRNERIEGLTEPHQIEVSIDGERLQLFTREPGAERSAVGSEPRTSRGRTSRPTQVSIVRAPVKAGPHAGAGGVPQEAVGAERNRASAVSGAIQQRPASAQAAGAVQRVDRGSVQRDGHRRDAEPQAHLRVPPGPAVADEAACAKTIITDAGAPRLSASGHG